MLNISCGPAKSATGCYKAKLVIKGICMNYVIQVLNTNADTSKVEKSWKDPQTGTVYENVFALESRCDFPSTINEGDEFYFNFADSAKTDCAVCMAYRDVPAKKNKIAILSGPCQ